MFDPPPPLSSALSVSGLMRVIKQLLENGFPLITLEGELSNLSRPGSGHLYFSLKDTQAQVRCAMFKGRASLLRFRPRDGMHVRVRARVTVYEPRGDLQLVVEHMEEAGEGALQRTFERLKQLLAAEGLFDPARKRPLPALPHRIGIITSLTGAALRDILHVLAKRFPLIPLRIYPSLVQGSAAADELVEALRIANLRAECDVLLLVRGGGSLEDLWPFNEERVARAIAASAIPIISGVGHETDFTIADLVADARAPTPSAAATMACPEVGALLTPLAAMENRLWRHMRDRLERHAQFVDSSARHLRAMHPRQRLERAAERMVSLQARLTGALRRAEEGRGIHLDRLMARLMKHHPVTRLELTTVRLDALEQRLRGQEAQSSARRMERIARLAAKLEALSPLATLGRGYALIEDARGHVVTRCSGLRSGDLIHAKMQDGTMMCEVRAIGSMSAMESAMEGDESGSDHAASAENPAWEPSSP
ncbi:MAG: exodeoxyribonuclease VII large subunit [Pseudomonadota bacterium]